MPIVTVSRDELFTRLEQQYTDEKFDELCFEFGIELDDVTSEKQMREKEVGAEAASKEELSDDVLYKIDVPANRYDLLCLEGITRALRVFLGKEEPAGLHVRRPEEGEPVRMVINPETRSVRPVVICAVLRGLTFTPVSYKSFIDLQDKLHQNICRLRTLASIGTHDLDTLRPPFTYEALPPEEIFFTPLNKREAVNGRQLFENIERDEAHLRPFLHIIKDKPRYPVIFDQDRTVLSLPPIINGDHSKITLNTKNVFIEVTATDATKAKIVLDIVCAMFSQYATPDAFAIEQVAIVGTDGKTQLTPDLAARQTSVSVDYINARLGLDLGVDKICALLNRMGLPSQSADEGKQVAVRVPVTRADVLQACDVMEDVAIAYGFNNLPRRVPPTVTIAKQQPLNKLSDLIRNEVAHAGYTEVLTLSLCGHDEAFKYMRREDDGKTAVKLANPKGIEFQIGRPCLLTGLLKTVASNKSRALPLRVFELNEVFFQQGAQGSTKTSDTGAVNERRLCVCFANTAAGFEIVQGVLDRVMQLNDVPFKFNPVRKEVRAGQVPRWTEGYELRESKHATFMEGHQADVLLEGEPIGVLGTVHPLVLHSFGIRVPVSAFEINVEPFV